MILANVGRNLFPLKAVEKLVQTLYIWFLKTFFKSAIIKHEHELSQLRSKDSLIYKGSSVKYTWIYGYRVVAEIMNCSHIH